MTRGNKKQEVFSRWGYANRETWFPRVHTSIFRPGGREGRRQRRATCSWLKVERIRASWVLEQKRSKCEKQKHLPVRWGRKRKEKREGPWEHYILIKEWLIIFQQTIFQGPRLMTKHGQHPTSIIRFPPRGERINNAPFCLSVPRPPVCAGTESWWAFPYSPYASLQPTNLSPHASCCCTGVTVLTSSSPLGMLLPSQEGYRERAGAAFWS